MKTQALKMIVFPVDHSEYSENNADQRVLILTRRIVNGDEAAFEELYSLYVRRLFGLALIITSGDEHLAKEVTQAVMIRAATHLKVFASERRLWAWLVVVTRHALVDFVRRESRHQARVIKASEGAADSESDEKLLRHLESAVENLNSEERQIVEQFYYEQVPQNKIAEQVGTTVKALQARLARAREKLRNNVLKKLKNEKE